ncbi:type II toxin-antitoxin system toxin DNA ADP-ribosyl transferase DarT [Hugenholtzia roseola]|uniref:type II toxin-antitoxin system toxin DNA ADP-ribosyl transferase DarT n=1 Tax=Hugenholtzia roseola TaxID=1002 RepID=UPI00040947A9|nr:DUF4433 domain-containing protein [Hugenholtzia roseola]
MFWLQNLAISSGFGSLQSGFLTLDLPKMPNLDKKYLFRMTHIENIPHILQNGITHSTSTQSNPDFVPIGDKRLIVRRNLTLLENGRRLGDYVPFYFGYRMPMLYVIQKGFNGIEAIPVGDIVYCVTTIQEIINLNLDFIFTDGHAVDKFSSQYTRADIGNIEMLIDYAAIRAKYWQDEQDLDKKRRKEAEFLILGDLPPKAVLGYVVYNTKACEKMIGFGASADKVVVKPEYYF